MMSVGDKGPLQRPYTVGTFQKRLDDFQEYIRQITYQEEEATPEERRQMITENLRYDQFCESIRNLFGADIRSQDLKAIYRKISTNPDAKVDWSELFGYFQSETEDQDLSVGEDVNVFTLPARMRVGDAAGDKKRRDVVQSLRYISSIDSYLSASQKGVVSVWSSKLRLQGCTDINETSWVTGCDYLRGMRRCAVSTERSINIWDNRAKGKNQQVFSVKPIEHSPQCMTWVPLAKNPHEDTLLFGDYQGCINMLTISSKDLTSKNSKEEKRYAESFTIEPSKLDEPIKRKKFHDDWVLRVRYYPELQCFASCSPSQNRSFVLEDLDRHFGEESQEKKEKRRTLGEDEDEIKYMKVPKGVNAFDFCPKANIIATGGVDKIVRVWHPHIFTRPTGKLLGHLFTIVDIVCNNKDQHIISLSTARVFRVWDIHTLTCLQVFSDNEERPGEKRIYSMLFCSRHDRLLTGSSVIDAWPLTRAVQDTMQVPHTHDRPISQVLYNPELKHLITVCTESTIKVWETETGKLVYQIPEVHGSNIEVTAIAVDKSGYRLATGAHDGSLKIWDFGSGQEIKWKTGKGEDNDYSVTGLVYCVIDGERCIIGAGWNNKLKIFLDNNDHHDIPVLREFSDVQYLTRETSLSAAHSLNKNTPLPSIGENPIKGSAQITNVFKKEYLLSLNEVTCVSFHLPNILITGCNTGSVILWDIQKATIDQIFKLPDPEPTGGSSSAKKMRRKQMAEHSVTATKVLVHRVRRLDPAYIAKLTMRSRHATQDEDGSEYGMSTNHSKLPGADQSQADTSGGDTSRNDSRVSVIQTQASKSLDVDVKAEGENTADEAIDMIADANQDNDTKEDRISKAASRHVQMTDDVETTGESPDVDPDAHMIIDSFTPVLVTCHHDSFIRFWSMQGELLRDISAVTRRQGSPVTAMCHDVDCNLMVTGDQKGYLTLWDIGNFLKDPNSEEKDQIKQVVCWRGHLTKITQLEYITNQKAVLSGSTDGSVRIWWGSKGRFVGFYGQHRAFNFPSSEEMVGNPILPYDINEGPLAPVKIKSARQKLKNNKYEYPLIFSRDKWKPFRRSAYFTERDKASPRDEEIDKKFFGALIKPRAYNEHLEGSYTGSMRQGAVFRALPVYRVRTPPRPTTPDISYAATQEDQDNAALFGGQNKGTKRISDTKVRARRKSYMVGRRMSVINSPSPRRR